MDICFLVSDNVVDKYRRAGRELKRMLTHRNKLSEETGKHQEWLEPHQCVEQIVQLRHEISPVSDLSRAIRINVLLRDR